MKKEKIYINKWLEIHPYKLQKESDGYFVELSNTIFDTLTLDDVPVEIRKRCALYLSAYLEDLISGLGLWRAFTEKCNELYKTRVPFYNISEEYVDGEVNVEDIRFIIWNTLYNGGYSKLPVNPMDKSIETNAIKLYDILSDEYEVAPENETLNKYFDGYNDEKEGKYKLEWLFGYTYLTQPSVQAYIKDLSESERFTVPCGPLALFLYEWLEIVCTNGVEMWRKISGLFFTNPEMSEKMKEKSKEIYQNFMDGNMGNKIAYVDGYSGLKKFLVNVLKWPDDENHMLPQMKDFKNFVLMCNEEKGMLIAHDICQYIKDPLNPYYNKSIAEKEAFSMLTVPTKCPPDLLEYLIDNRYIPDVQFPKYGDNEITVKFADFIARCSLLYYYRGD